MHIQDVLLFVPVLLFSVIAHEYAHGYAALKQGDTTALSLGRLTWNPIKHIDPFMTILLPALLYYTTRGAVVLGGAKPVPVNPRNYRNFKRGDIIVSLAGVFVNFLLAIASVVLFVGLGLLGRAAPNAENTLAIVQAMMFQALRLNLVLLAFNLIPIPPLDGSHVMKYLLPPSWSLRYQQFGRYGIVILVLLLGFGSNFLSYWMRPAFAFGGFLFQWANPYSLPSLDQWLS
ncbi:MAG TPA: site-2 protease family protein [Gemmatimonadaceae bacterium]|nr:site-2 protease family protein [Gemmatimonadaceae bacterium]